MTRQIRQTGTGSDAVEMAREIVAFYTKSDVELGALTKREQCDWILARELLRLAAENEAMRGVVEAAGGWRDVYSKPRDAMNWDAEEAWTRINLGKAVDAYRALAAEGGSGDE